MIIKKISKTIYIILLSVLILNFIACGSLSSNNSESEDDFVVVTGAEETSREEILKSLFTEEMYNTITEKSQNNQACKESNRAELLPEGVQNLPNGQWYYTYENLIAGMAHMEGFGAASDDENINKLEIAAFLANIAQETGTGTTIDPTYGGLGCFIQEGGGSARQSCTYGGCVNTPGYDSEDLCNEDNDYLCPEGDFGWCGRGPHQLSWAANYTSFGQAMSVENEYRNDPDILTKNPDIGIAGSIWFWGHKEQSSTFPDNIPFKPSAHEVVLGEWTPTESDIECGRTEANLGIITNIINGGIECGPNASARGLENAEHRVTFFNNIANVLGVTVPDGWAVNCAEQKNFAECPSYRDPTSRCGSDWTDANTKCGTYCAVDADCSTGEKCFGSLSANPCL